MHFIQISVAIVAFLSVQVAGQADRGQGLYSDYNYCQGISPIAHKTYKPIKGARLQKVQVMMRHGDRTPSTVLPGDHTHYNICSRPAEISFLADQNLAKTLTPFLRTHILVSDENVFAPSYWKGNCEVGQLTNRGSEQTRQVGRNLRSIYVDQVKFLKRDLEPKEIYLRNTFIWRTKESVENFLEGLYPRQHRRSDAVVTLNTYPQTIETLILNPTACPKLGVLFSGFFKTPTYAAYIRANYALMTKLNTVLGVTHIPTVNMTLNGDAVMPRYCNRLPLGCSPSDPSLCLTSTEVIQAMSQSTFPYSAPFRHEGTAETIKRLAVGPILKTLANSIRTTVYPAAPSSSSFDRHGGGSLKRVRSFEVFSAHDQSLDQILAVISDPSIQVPWPAYASTLIFESWKMEKSGKVVMRVLYEGKVVPAHPLMGCQLDSCEVEKFLAFVEGYVPEDMVAECAL